MNIVIPTPKGIWKFRQYTQYNKLKTVYFTDKIIDKNTVPGTIACLTFPPGGGIVVATDATKDEIKADINLWNSICFIIPMEDKLDVEYNIDHCIRVSGNTPAWRNFEKTGNLTRNPADVILKEMADDYFENLLSGHKLAEKYGLNISSVYKYLKQHKKQVLKETGVMLERT